MPPVNLQVAFCEERVECRRVLLLTYFGERGFTKERCGATCDVCLRNVGQRFEGAHRSCCGFWKQRQSRLAVQL